MDGCRAGPFYDKYYFITTKKAILVIPIGREGKPQSRRWGMSLLVWGHFLNVLFEAANWVKCYGRNKHSGSHPQAVRNENKGLEIEWLNTEMTFFKGRKITILKSQD